MTAPVLNFVSDVATPHVNQLLSAVVARGDVDVRPWYAYLGSERGYSWKVDPTFALPSAKVFGHVPNGQLLARAASPLNRDAFMIVGWSNPTTRALIPILTARRRRFAFFTDRPKEDRARPAKALLRRAYFAMLKRSATVFAVGQSAVDYFTDRGFRDSQLQNLPMPVPAVEGLEDLRANAREVRERLGVDRNGFLVVSGSRLTRDKGFDLLIAALSGLPAEARQKVTLLIVGDGPEQSELERLARVRGLERQVLFEPWMEFPEFCAHMCAADVVAHPARFDAFGGTTLTAVAVGAPVVGAREAGAVAQLVEDGVNGRVYSAEDVAALTAILLELIGDPQQLARLRGRASQMISRWTAEQLADTLVRRLQAEAILDSRSER